MKVKGLNKTFTLSQKQQKIEKTNEKKRIADVYKRQLYEKYKALTGKYPNMHLLGRLAEYKYYNIDAMTEKALELTKELLK